MGGKLAKLKPVEVPRLAKSPGMHGDGGGLYLRATRPSAASWVFRFMMAGRPRTMGLGPFPEISLADARELAAAARRLKATGIDPIDARDEEKAAERLRSAKSMTFKECAEAYIKSQRDGWRNPKHAYQWGSTLATYAYPIIGDLPVTGIDASLVMQVLEQEVPATALRPAQRLWIAKSETASRLRGRLESILGWAAARDLRSGDNPARWKGQLEHQLPAPSKVTKVEHHPALPYNELAPFLATLRKQDGLAAKALEFTILTAARTGEALGATWNEIDLDAKQWIVAPGRMKAGREHRVPLPGPAIALLEDLKIGIVDDNPYVFAGAKPGKPLSNMAMLVLLKRMKRDDLTVHGFRSAFRDWVSEETSYPGDLAEMALAHTISNKVEAAYKRGDQLEKRRKLMEEWATYCNNITNSGDEAA